MKTLRVLSGAAVASALLLAPRPAAAQKTLDPVVGKTVYEAKCIACHGADGKGNGIAAAFLDPRPRDFTAGKYKFRTTESGSIPTDGDILATVKNGLAGTAMPAWKSFIGDDSLRAVVSYVKSFSPRFQSETPKEVKPGAQPPSSPAGVAAGAKVYERLGCASCHGAAGDGQGATTPRLVDDWGREIKAADLTKPWTFRGGPAAADIYLRFRTGVDGSPMPSYAGSANERDLRDLANFVASLGTKPLWELDAPAVRSRFAAEDAWAKEHPVERGRHLVATLGCAYCHSPVRDDGSLVEEMKFAGGQRWDLYPFDNLVSYNLTSDKETGLGNWTDEQIKNVLTKGTRRNGTRMIPYPMPWPAMASLTESDLNAIIAYLRTIPPIVNRIPDPQSPNVFSYLWGKFRALILKEDLPLKTFAGNAGTPGSPAQAGGREGGQ